MVVANSVFTFGKFCFKIKFRGHGPKNIELKNKILSRSSEDVFVSSLEFFVDWSRFHLLNNFFAKVTASNAKHKYKAIELYLVRLLHPHSVPWLCLCVPGWRRLSRNTCLAALVGLSGH